MTTKKNQAVEVTAQGKTKNSGISGTHAKPAVKKTAKVAVKKVGRSGSVSGAAVAGALVGGNVKAVKAAVERATKAASPKVAAPAVKKRNAAKKAMFDKNMAEANAAPVIDHLRSTASDTKLQNAGLSGAFGAVPATPSTGAASTNDKYSSADLSGAIRAAHSDFPENDYLFFREVIKNLKAITGELFLVHVYERLIHDALGDDAVKRYPLGKRLEKTLRAWPVMPKDEPKPDEVNLGSQQCTVDPNQLIQKLADAANNATATINTFKEEDRGRLHSFAIFFERFWAFIVQRLKIDRNFNSKEFHQYLDSTEYKQSVMVGEYACFTFNDKTRAIVIRSAVGSAAMLIAENEFVASLKNSPLPKDMIEEQTKMNPPSVSLLTRMPLGLTALVSDSWPEKSLRLSELHRIFGDPIYYAFGAKQNNLAHAADQLAKLFAKFSA